MSNHTDYWQAIWAKALANMPVKRNGTGKWGALCFALGWPLYSPGGSYSGHSRVYGNWLRGHAPRDPEIRARLLKIAAATPDDVALALRNARHFNTPVQL